MTTEFVTLLDEICLDTQSYQTISKYLSDHISDENWGEFCLNISKSLRTLGYECSCSLYTDNPSLIDLIYSMASLAKACQEFDRGNVWVSEFDTLEWNGVRVATVDDLLMMATEKTFNSLQVQV